VHGDSPWSIEVQLTHAQIDTYLDDRVAKGFNAILFQPMEHLFSSQTPPWKNAQSGAVPFASTTSNSLSWGNPVEDYWRTVDYVVNGARARGIICFITPAYLGFGGGAGAPADQGWMGAVTNAAAADLRAYGAFLGNRYNQGNIVWVMGGDYAGTTAERDKQWNVALGIRQVRAADLITGHPMRSDEEAYPFWSGYTGFNLNTIYTNGIEYVAAARAYGRPGAMPFVLIEGRYEGDGVGTPASLRRQAYASILSGACGHFFGAYPIWGFGEPVANGGAGAASALASSLSSTATTEMAHVPKLFLSYEWWKLVPRIDASLVTSTLGSGTSRICPALAGDGSFAMIWVPAAGTVTVNMSALSASGIRARYFEPANGGFAAVAGSPFANAGVRSFSVPGERVLVLDAV
jgi:hypothetical protein